MKHPKPLGQVRKNIGWAAIYAHYLSVRGRQRALPTLLRVFAMAVKIIESCVNCFACEPVCPSNAIYEAKPHFLVDPKKCTECEGDFPDYQCASICPIEGAILNALGEAINPPGSLTGIPPEKMAEAMAELQSH
jgi:ferredoxin